MEITEAVLYMLSRGIGWLLLFSGCASAATWFLPGAQDHTDTAGIHYGTDVRIFNWGSVPANVTIDLITAAGVAPPQTLSQVVASSQTLVLTGILASAWQLAEQSGTLRITADQAVAIFAQTSPDGKTGYPLPVVSDDQLIEAGDIGHTIWVAQTPVSNAIAGVAIGALASSVDVVAYDTQSQELGRTTVAGSSLVMSVPVSSLVNADVPIVRVEFQVNSGRALGYLWSTDLTSGDTALAAAQSEQGAAASAVVLGAANQTDPDGTLRTTDARIFNLSAATATVTCTVASSNSGLTGTVQLSLASGELREIQDILGANVAATSGTQAELLITAGNSIVVEARRRWTRPDATSASYGDFLAQPAGDNPGAMALAGLHPDDVIGLQSGPDGATATVSATDPSGNTIAALNGSLVLPAMSTQAMPLSSLVAGVTLPADTSLQLTVATGELDAYSQRAGAEVTGAQYLNPYTCPLPSIDSFQATPISLPAAGVTSVDWSVSGADAVTLDAAGGPVDASGTLDVNLTQTTTFTLTATGACGSTSQSVQIALGSPAIIGIDPASAMPGQTVTITMGNSTDADAIQGVILTLPDGSQRELTVQPGTTAASLAFNTPLIPTGTDATYFTGPVQLALDSLNGVSSTSSFAITAYPPPATDVVPLFRAFLNDGAAFSQARYADFQADATTAPTVAMIQPLVDGTLANLNAMLDSIAATGAADLPVDLPSAAYPTPATVHITRQHLETMWAAMQPMMLPPADDSTSSARLQPRAVDGLQWELRRIDGYSSCLNSLLDEWNSIVNRSFFDQFKFWAYTTVSTTVSTFAVFTGQEYVVLSNNISKLADDMNLSCNAIYPIALQYFRAQPNPDPLPYDPFNIQARVDANGRVNNGVTLYADFTTVWTRAQAATMLSDIVENGIKKGLQLQQATGVAPAQIHSLAIQIYQATQEIIQQLLAKSANVPGTQEQIVYKGDLATVDTATARTLVRDSAEEPNNVLPSYGFKARIPGGVASVSIHTIPKHFIDPFTSNTFLELRGIPTQPYYASFQAGRAVKRVVARTLNLGGSTTTAYGSEQSITFRNPISKTYNCPGGGVARGSLTQTGSSTWRMSLFANSPVDHTSSSAGTMITTRGRCASGMLAVAFLVPARGQQQKVHLQSTVTSVSDLSADIVFVNGMGSINLGASVTFPFTTLLNLFKTVYTGTGFGAKTANDTESLTGDVTGASQASINIGLGTTDGTMTGTGSIVITDH
jgi:hypothetical protein